MSEQSEDLEGHLAAFEVALEGGEHEEARGALRRYLFASAGRPVDGSAMDAVAALAERPAGRGEAASVVLRAVAAGMLPEDRGLHLARYVSALAEVSLPDLCAYLGVKPRLQNFEKFELLRGAHDNFASKLDPLRTPYLSMDTFLAARPRIAAALGHGQTRTYCRPYAIGKVSEQVDRLMGAFARAAEMGPGFGSDVGACRREIASAKELVASVPSFLTLRYLRPLVESAEQVLHRFLAIVQGRFTAEIVRDGTDGADLQKRFPLHEEGRELRVVVPFRNEGPGPANDVAYVVTSPTQSVAISDAPTVLGTIAPGEFSVAFDVLVTSPCDRFDVEIQIAWGEIGDPKRREEIYGARALAQRADVDWGRYKYWNPYSIEPAQGSGFYGREEQVETLVARVLQRPMEPSYITGQKRVGKTSLARTAVDRAGEQGVPGELTTG